MHSWQHKLKAFGHGTYIDTGLMTQNATVTKGQYCALFFSLWHLTKNNYLRHMLHEYSLSLLGDLMKAKHINT